MPENEDCQAKAKNENSAGNNISLTTSFIAIGVATTIFLIVLGVTAYFRVNEHSERIRFFTVNTLSWIVFMAVVTQIVIYKKQWHAMRDTLSEMKTSRELTNRAWIGVKSIEIEENPDGGIKIIAAFLNSGATPANVTIQLKGEPRTEPPPDDITIGPFQDEGSHLALFPNVEHRTSIARLPALPLFNNPREAWYIYGRLDYEDIFGHPHVTRFCYHSVDLTTKAQRKQGQLRGTLVVSGTHNSFN